MSTTLDRDLLKAARAGDLAGVDTALRGGARVDVQDEYHNTPLNEAAIWGHTEVVKRLLEEGADIENKGSSDLTPLGLATTRGHFGGRADPSRLWRAGHRRRPLHHPDEGEHTRGKRASDSPITGPYDLLRPILEVRGVLRV